MTDFGGSCGSEPAALGNVCCSMACSRSNSEYLPWTRQKQTGKATEEKTKYASSAGRQSGVLLYYTPLADLHGASLDTDTDELAGCISSLHMHKSMLLPWAGSALDWPQRLWLHWLAYPMGGLDGKWLNSTHIERLNRTVPDNVSPNARRGATDDDVIVNGYALGPQRLALL